MYGWAAAWVVAVVLDSEAEVEVVLVTVVAVVAVVGAVVVVAEEPHATANTLTATSRSTTALHMRTRRGLNADIGKSTSHFVFRLALRRSNTRITAESRSSRPPFVSLCRHRPEPPGHDRRRSPF